MTKLFIEEHCFKKYSPRPDCPFCDYIIVWKHARYIRTGTHSKILKIPPEERTVQRYLCKSPDCGRTFPVLPENTLPYCRFDFKDFLCIHALYQKGMSTYSLWKSCHLAGVSINVIVRLLKLFKKVLALVQSLFRELNGEVNEDLASMSHFLIKKYTWFGFTSRWYHALYPARLWENQNPHNLGLQTG